MGTIGYIRDTIRETQEPLKNSTYIILECIEKLRTCGIVGEELESLASAAEILETTYDSLHRKLNGLRAFDSNQTGDDYIREVDE